MEEQAGCSSWDETAAATAAEGELNTSNSSLMPASSPMLSMYPQPPALSTPEQSPSESLCTDLPCEDHKPWQLIPDIVVVHILSYLSDVDRCHASVVCKSWRQAFRNPSLWRRRYFVFRGYDAMEKLEMYQRYLAQLGRHMQSLVVDLGHPLNIETTGTTSAIAKAFQQFVNSFNKTLKIRLLKMRIGNALFIRRISSLPSRGRVIRSLCKLLKKQSFLRSVDLSNFFANRQEGTLVLNALSYGTRRHPKTYLADIDLRGFFCLGTKVTNFLRYCQVMGQFQALTTIRMDVTNLTETILERLTRASARTLRYVDLDFRADESAGAPAISPECWQSVSERLPGMTVKVWIGAVRCRFQKCTSVLVRGIPLSELHVNYFGNDPGLLTGICSLITYLADAFHATLSKLRLMLGLRPYIKVSVDAAMVALVKKCLQLRELHVVSLALQAGTVVLILDIICRRCALRAPPPLQLLPPSKRTRFHFDVRGTTPELDGIIRLMSQKGYCDVTVRTLSVASVSAALADREQ